MANVSNKYHYFYKITNNINGHFYYGVHNTNNLEDGYMGSGARLHYAYKKYGVENFTKEILKFFDTSKEAFEYEAEVVTDKLISQEECYNIELGGKYFNNEGLIHVKDVNGNIYVVSVNDPRYISGELTHLMKNKILCKDKNNKCYWIEKNDPRYLSGELKLFWINNHHKKESLDKMKCTMKNINHQQGKKNSQYGTCWITKNNENKKIKKEDLLKYISDGWKQGRYIK